MSAMSEIVLTELERIRQKDLEGKLRPKAVVDTARDPAHPLHKQFEWDDSVAAEKHRLDQARNLIRVAVTVLEVENKTVKVRAYQSLSTDRDKGGYRRTVDVMSDDQLRSILLADALAELRSFQARYSRLNELAGVFRAYYELRDSQGGPGGPSQPQANAG